jgi:hypothetical protein
VNHIASPRTDDGAIEEEIRRKGMTAPRVTPADIEANIDREYYFTAADGVDGRDIADQRAMAPAKALSVVPLEQDHTKEGTLLAPLNLLTFCVLVLRNGFTVTGESACASPENFDAEIGRKIARQSAVNKVWPLMGYALKNDLWRASLPQMTEAKGA